MPDRSKPVRPRSDEKTAEVDDAAEFIVWSSQRRVAELEAKLAAIAQAAQSEARPKKKKKVRRLVVRRTVRLVRPDGSIGTTVEIIKDPRLVADFQKDMVSLYVLCHLILVHFLFSIHAEGWRQAVKDGLRQVGQGTRAPSAGRQWAARVGSGRAQ